MTQTERFHHNAKDFPFRHESGRLIAALTRQFGPHNITLVEDAVQDAFCRAVDVWCARGVPEQPAEWLMNVAKHRAMELFRRENMARLLAADIGRLKNERVLGPALDDTYDADRIADDQLRMMFSCCDPHLANEVRIVLLLSLLCGFRLVELCSALLVPHSAVEKRLSRGKRALARNRRLFDLAGPDTPARLEIVQQSLYALFHEGYSAAGPTARPELCGAAISLGRLLSADARFDTPTTNALGALMCLSAARLPARPDSRSDFPSSVKQNPADWGTHLVLEGRQRLDLAARGGELTRYHVEAAIAVLHTEAMSIADTNWRSIIALYDQLLRLAPSTSVAMRRAVAISHVAGVDRGLAALREIGIAEQPAAYPFYFATIAELELRLGKRDAARTQFQAAAALARTEAERRFLERRAVECDADATSASECDRLTLKDFPTV